jgi:hypothetical protein
MNETTTTPARPIEQALEAVRAAYPRLGGTFSAGRLTETPRDVHIRYAAPSGELTRQWLYRADVTPSLIELDPPSPPSARAPVALCKGSSARVDLSADERAAKRTSCPTCGAALRVRVGRSAGGARATLPRHKPAMREGDQGPASSASTPAPASPPTLRSRARVALVLRAEFSPCYPPNNSAAWAIPLGA